MNIIGPHDYRAIAHPKSALSWGNAIQGCATSNARFEPRDCSQFSRWVQQLRAAATRDKSFFLSREALATYTNAPPAGLLGLVPALLNQAQDFDKRCRDRA